MIMSFKSRFISAEPVLHSEVRQSLWRSNLPPWSQPGESPEGKFFSDGYFVQDVSDILQNISELQCTHVQWVYGVHPTPARTGGWCHCLEWTGEDMVQTSGGWTNHRPGMAALSQWQPRVERGRGPLELRTVSTGPPCHSSSISQAQQDTAQPGSGDRHKVKQTSDSVWPQWQVRPVWSKVSRWWYHSSGTSAEHAPPSM